VYYCNVLLQYSTAFVLCVCYCNVVLQYNTVKRYCYVCVLL